MNGFVLTRHWRDTREGIALSFWAATAEGPLRIVVGAQEAVCFINRGSSFRLPHGARRRAVDLCRLTQSEHSAAPVDALYFPQQRQLTRALAEPGARAMLAEADIKPTDRYLMERFVRAGFVAKGVRRWRGDYWQMDRPRVQPHSVRPVLRSIAIDIETQGLDGVLYSIALVAEDAAEVLMLGDRPACQFDEFRLSFHATEAELIRAAFEWLRRQDPDILMGWNVVDFDLDFLYRRCQKLGVEFALARAGEQASVLAAKSPQQPKIAQIPGRVVLDGIELLRAGFWSFERFSLDFVAKALLGEGKLLDDSDDRVAEIDALFRNDQNALARYNYHDCICVRRIFDKAALLDFAIERADLTGLSMSRLGGSVAAFDHLYLPRLHRRGFVADTTGARADSGPGSPGGYVLDSQPGIHQNVLVFDFKSLYPSIIRTFLVDPLGLVQACDDPVPGFDGGEFCRDQPILPAIIDELWAQRERAKAQVNAPLSQAIKIIMNSFYGVLGTPRCRFHDHRLASSITRRGHQIITESRDYLETKGLQVIYGDTDSLFVLLGELSSGQEPMQEGRRMAAELNDWWADRIASDWRLESALEVEFETYFERFLMPTVRGANTGSKKRYAGLTRDAQDNPRVVIKGLEAVRNDWTPLARRLQRELLERVFTDQPYHDLVRTIDRAMRDGQLDDQLIYRKRLRRPLSDYQRNIPPHVQAAKQLPKPTRQVEYLMTFSGPQPLGYVNSKIDYEHYRTRQLAPAADTILSFLGTDYGRLTAAQIPLF